MWDKASRERGYVRRCTGSPGRFDSYPPHVLTYPLIDVDLGIGRQWGYDDRARRYWAGTTSESQDLTAIRNPAKCHPARKHRAHGLCNSCYNIWMKCRRQAACGKREMTQRQACMHLVGSGHENP